MDYALCRIGDLPLLKGGLLKDASVAYSTRGELNASGTNAVLCPIFFGGDLSGYDWLVGSGLALDTDRYCVVIAGLFGDGLSTSPSNYPPGLPFPHISVQDNVRAQHRLLNAVLGVSELTLVAGWSMGASHAYQWAVSYPDAVRRVAAVCGSPMTSEHCKVFLSALSSALRTSGEESPVAAARMFASWGASHAFWKDQTYQTFGFDSREDYLIGFWEPFFSGENRSTNLLAMLSTWQDADVGKSTGFAGDTLAALKSIRAETVLLPAERDLCFAADDEAEVARLLTTATLRIIPGSSGHMAGAGIASDDREWIGSALRKLLETNA